MNPRIPYGVSNFSRIREKVSLFIDHTSKIRNIEDAPDTLLLLRPRRFGKSLWISILEHYYDLRFADRFDALFAGLDIGLAPTDQRSRYLVLVLDFSSIHAQGSAEEVAAGFLEVIRLQLTRFMDDHEALLPDPARARIAIETASSPAAVFAVLAGAVARSGHPLYVLIDEYDNFTNELVATGQEKTYGELVKGTGIVRTFFKTIKQETRTGVVARCFLTGVNPILLNDLTSGFNIATDVSQEEEFSDLLGFSHDEVEGLVRQVAPPAVDNVAMLQLMEAWYDGYRFHRDGPALFNPDMVLYFLRSLARGEPPAQILDANLRTDIHKLGLVAKGLARDRVVFEACVRGLVVGVPGNSMDIDGLLDPVNLPSLLYWLGMLSLGTKPGTLRIPNYAVAGQYWEETLQLISRETGLDSVVPIREALGAMMGDGNGESFFRLVVDLVLKRISNRDLLQWGEASVKAILLSFLSLTNDVSAFSEWETNRGYADLVIIPSPHASWLEHAWMIELKYLKKGEDTPSARNRCLSEGQDQLQRYQGDEVRMRYLSQFRLHTAVAIYVDAEDLVWWEADGA